MGKISQDILPPARPFKTLPEHERRTIRNILSAYIQGSDVMWKGAFGVEGSLETMISLCDKGILKINPIKGTNDEYEIYVFKNKWDGYVEIALIKYRVEE